MRGHENIIAMRIRHIAPKIVFINDFSCKTDWEEHGDHATVCTHAEPVYGLDLRFLTGLAVSISASTEIRAKALFERAKQAGAKTVAAAEINPGLKDWEQSGWIGVHHG
jgi:hypothetical protein